MSDPPLPPAASATPSTKGRVASDALLEKIDREMDEAFMWNVTRNREIQMTFKAPARNEAGTPPRLSANGLSK